VERVGFAVDDIAGVGALDEPGIAPEAVETALDRGRADEARLPPQPHSHGVAHARQQRSVDEEMGVHDGHAGIMRAKLTIASADTMRGSRRAQKCKRHSQGGEWEWR